MKHESNDGIRSEMREGEAIDKLVLERLFLHISTIETRLRAIEENPPAHVQAARPAGLDPIGKLEEQVRGLQDELRRVNERAGNMRFDRQVKVGMKRLKAHLVSNDRNDIPQGDRLKADRDMMLTSDVAIICGAYPGGSRAYGGQFVKSRLDSYYRAKFKPSVIEVSPRTSTLVRHRVDGVDVLRVNPAGLAKILRFSRLKAIGVHSIERPVWDIIRPALGSMPLFVWVHGFEARAWEELAFNFTENELKMLRPRLDKANAERRMTMSDVMKYPNVQMIYVSNYMRAVAEGFARTIARAPHIIPNPVDPKDFPYIRKRAKDRKNLLWLRSFSDHNYASDISRDVIIGLSKKPFFTDLNITIVGDGKYFDEMTAPLGQFSNVTIKQSIVDRAEMRRLFRGHGVKIIPTRWDSHGLTACEAMHSGLVPLTSSVAGLREYIDPESAVIAQFDEVEALVDGFSQLYANPKKFLTMSAAAHQKSAQLCGPDNTTNREIALMRRELAKL